ncbi:GmrSD restriction endonuclease domain-containing protein [Azospirillum sp.]|uniref:GmrSD restriction endonuclease domain-containing protein n=1 Tax=Azospirillum sp. TaxID=34012 RepID=UPI003D7169E4
MDRWNGGGRRSWRRLSPGALLLALALLGGAALLERLDLLPPGTVERLLGQEPKRPAYRVPAVPPDAARVDVAEVEGWLARVRVVAEKQKGYRREDWPHWAEVPGSCRDVRAAVLIRDSLEPVQLSSDGCRVIRGRWRDSYTGQESRDPHELDIDHRVPLDEAHDSGGHAWSRERRAAYANDLTDRRTLVTVAAAVNRAKGSKGPDEWLPPDRTQLCRYVADWVAVKLRWELAVDARERAAIDQVLDGCRRAGR